MKVALALLLATGLFVQTPKRLEFEVASVRPAEPNQGQGPQTPAGAQTYESQIRLTYLTFRDLVVRAYQVRAYQVTGPDWINTERYDILATLPRGVTAPQPEMFQVLLEQRFGLKVRKAQKEFDVYTLERGKQPFTLKQVQANEDTRTTGVAAPRAAGVITMNLARGATFSYGDAKFDGNAMTMDMLANQSSGFLTVPVINKTGVDGFYDLHFEVDPEDFQVMVMTAASKRGVSMPPEMLVELEARKPTTYFEALEKVGLKLERGKAMLDVIDIEDAKRMPTEN